MPAFGQAKRGMIGSSEQSPNKNLECIRELHQPCDPEILFSSLDLTGEGSGSPLS